MKNIFLKNKNKIVISKISKVGMKKIREGEARKHEKSFIYFPSF